MSTHTTDVAILGGGLAGLTCAKILEAHNINYTLVEKSNCVGGRVKTEHINGFKCDVGFQVLLTAYDEPKKHLDLEALNLCHFLPGAKLIKQNQTEFFINPLQHFRLGLRHAFPLKFKITDYLKLIKLYKNLVTMSFDDISKTEETSTLNYLKQLSFSDSIISTFFKPFFSGVFLDQNLVTSSHLFKYYFKCFLTGFASIPEEGMSAIPNQLLSQLNPSHISLNETIKNISGKTVITDSRRIKAKHIVSALNFNTIKTLLNLKKSLSFNNTICLYFILDTMDTYPPILYLNSNKKSVINTMMLPTSLSPNFSPDNRHLISVSLTPNLSLSITSQIILDIQKEVSHILKCPLQNLSFLTYFNVDHALPLQKKCLKIINSDDIYFSGDWTNQGSIQGAMLSGRKAAERVLDRINV